MKEIEGRASERASERASVPWSADQTDVSGVSLPLAFSPAPSVSARPSSAAAPASSAAPAPAVGTESLPAGSSAGPVVKEKREDKEKQSWTGGGRGN